MPIFRHENNWIQQAIFNHPWAEKLQEFNFHNLGYIYFLIRNDVLVYIGKTKNLEFRIRIHQKLNKIKFDRVLYITAEIAHLNIIEGELIRYAMPKENSRFGSPLEEDHLAILEQYGMDKIHSDPWANPLDEKRRIKKRRLKNAS